MTLTEVSFYTRKFAPVGIIAGLVILIFVFGFRLLLLYLEIQSTAPKTVATTPVATDQVFGPIKRPQLPMPSRLQTIHGFWILLTEHQM